MSSTSPIARDVDDVALLMKAVIGPQLWQLDFDVAPIPFNNEVWKCRVIDSRQTTIHNKKS